MLHAESSIRFLECQNEITVEPCSKKMKSMEGAYEKHSDDDNQGIEEEVDAERTSNNLIPTYASDNQGQHAMQKQEKILAGVSGTLNEVLPENNLVLTQPVDSETVQNVNPPFASINDTKFEETKDSFITDPVDGDNIKNYSALFSVNANASAEFFTSKDFIGPIYKPAESNKQNTSGSSNECRSSEGDQNASHENSAKRKEAKKMQTISSAVPKIDDELDQFYKEIHQLENENLASNFQEKETETSQELYSPSNYSQTSQEGYQCALLGSSQPLYENGQYFGGEENSQKTSSEQQFVMETSDWKTENTFNGQEDSKYWNYSVPEFRPAWQSMQSFIVPQGPLPPGFNHQSNLQILNSPLQKANALPSQNGELSYKNYHGYHGNTDTNSHSPLLEQSTNCAGHVDTHTSQVFRNGNNDQKRLQSSGFCETKEYWKDPKACHTVGMHSSSLQLPEETFSCSKKLLLILRGLPGSGKSTLSRILLGQSREGIVFSTDDYFHQQDGYTYNAAHLGDAHDWNQRRAKQAMEQGKSPVIIDNTNTQAWEMKPYVEVALEKGYRVEFHEPDTWWKFDPEELEKRNKHGVTREKIAQMLERYEYPISIPIVMNSVVPPHKNTPRPPLQRRHREKILKKSSEHLLAKAKQRKKRKRNKNVEDNHTEIMTKVLGGAVHHPSPGDQGTSMSEEDDLEEENGKALCTFSEEPEDPVKVCEEHPNGDDEGLKEAAVVSRERFVVAVPEVSEMSKNEFKEELPIERDSALLIDAKAFSAESLTKNSFHDEETNQRHKEILSRSNLLKINNDENFIPETEGISEDYSMPLLSTKSKLELYQIDCKTDTEARLLSLKGEEKEIPRCSISNKHDIVPDNNTEHKGALKAKENNSSAWAFLSVNSLTEKLPLGFDTHLSLLSCSGDKCVGEQRPPKWRKPKQTQINSSTQLNFCQSDEGLVKENHQGTVTKEDNNVVSNGLLTSPAGEMHCDFLMKTRVTFIQCLNEVNVPRSDAGPIISKRKRYRRIVNLAPKFNLPRQIAGNTEREKEVPIKDEFAQKSVLEVEQKSFLSKDCGEEREQDCALQDFSCSGTKGTCSLASPHANALLHDISYINLGQPSSMPKYSYRVCAVSTTKEKKKQVVDKREDESEQIPSEATNSQPNILSSVKVVSEYLEDSSMLAGCSENMHERDDPEPSEASQLEDNQDLNMKCSFLGLPLSLGFAFQLVQLFGSPGLPLGKTENKWIAGWKHPG
ncbi:uncharacterized protein LOC104306106 isoform X2 [Dryobates pubescens]|uniref:uncharacterized protein LOC104306106 isoform X2 n=1 Tax=Dryobates pubescens TaxID=118200 RepID=UPI0023B9BCAB|nr:uncharacterized protein LOC104306106 isoform X2 [Dryobates pubescens]